MYIARKITDYSKFRYWCSDSFAPFAFNSGELDDFSDVIDFDDNLRTLKRRVSKHWHGYFEKVLIFHDNTLVSWRHMAFNKRWCKWRF